MSKVDGVWTEEEELLESAILAFHSLAEEAERVATGGADGRIVISDGVSRLAKRAAAYAAKNPNPPRPPLYLPDPLARLAAMAERLRDLIPPAFDGDEPAFLKVRAGELAAKCRELSAVSATRLEGLLEKRQSEAARVRAEAARGEAEQKAATLRGERDTWRTVATGQGAEILAAARASAARSAGAERAALRAEAAAKGRAKADALDADLVATFRDYDTAQKGEEGTQEEIAAGVLADAREEGRLLGSMGPRAFLNAWRQWVKWKRPEAEAYGAKKRPRRRG